MGLYRSKDVLLDMVSRKCIRSANRERTTKMSRRRTRVLQSILAFVLGEALLGGCIDLGTGCGTNGGGIRASRALLITDRTSNRLISVQSVRGESGWGQSQGKLG